MNQLIFIFSSLVAHHQELLLFQVSIVDVSANFKPTPIIQSNFLKSLPRPNFIVNLHFQLPKLVFPVLFFLVQEARLPLPEGFDASVLLFDTVLVLFKLLLVVADQLNYGGFGFINAAFARKLNPSEPCRQISKPRCNYVVESIECCFVLDLCVEDDV